MIAICLVAVTVIGARVDVVVVVVVGEVRDRQEQAVEIALEAKPCRLAGTVNEVAGRVELVVLE